MAGCAAPDRVSAFGGGAVSLCSPALWQEPAQPAGKGQKRAAPPRSPPPAWREATVVMRRAPTANRRRMLPSYLGVGRELCVKLGQNPQSQQADLRGKHVTEGKEAGLSGQWACVAYFRDVGGEVSV